MWLYKHLKTCFNYLIMDKDFIVIENLLDHLQCKEILKSINNNCFISTYNNSELSNKIKQQLSSYLGFNIYLSDKWYSKIYNPGECIDIHMDGTKKGKYNRSFATLLLYLNDCKEGGETCFVNDFSLDPIITDKIKAKTGTALILRQDIYHMSLPSNETKYILRNDLFKDNLICIE